MPDDDDATGPLADRTRRDDAPGLRRARSGMACAGRTVVSVRSDRTGGTGSIGFNFHAGTGVRP